MDQQRINLSFYRFCTLGDEQALRDLRVRLKTLTAELQLKGTILIAPEGINAMVSGTRSSLDALKAYCSEHFGTQPSDFKEAQESPSGELTCSFKRMLVKIKKEIITVGAPSVKPSERTAPRISAQELKQWLDAGRPVTLLDTRNDYEVKTGTFENAQTLDLDTSREFTNKAKQQLEQLKLQAQVQPLVTFCTGGIRCEKASAVLLDLGLENVYQLDGGILRYFEENGAAHFQGNCFVFDWRLAVDGRLQSAPRASNVSSGRHRLKDSKVD